MMINDRHTKILEELKANPNITVKELSKILFVSEPTIRRDFTELHNKGFITKVYGGAILNEGYADREIPFFFRENENSAVKMHIAKIAAEKVHDSMVVMLDGSTSSYYVAKYLAKKKDIIVVTSGAKTAVRLAEENIRVFSTGGQMIVHSFSYVGKQAEDFVRSVNADILFFSCHGVSANGKMTDPSLEETNLRRVMFENANIKILLCDSSKFNKTYINTLGNVSEIDEIISEKPVPNEILNLLKK